jgi:hypothetical protein
LTYTILPEVSGILSHGDNLGNIEVHMTNSGEETHQMQLNHTFKKLPQFLKVINLAMKAAFGRHGEQPTVFE